MKIGIVTYIKDDNYGEELQAFAMQYYLNSQGWDAEVIDLEKRVKDLSKSKDAIIPAIINRFKVYNWKAPYFILKKIVDVWRKKDMTTITRNIKNNSISYLRIFSTNTPSTQKNTIPWMKLG